MTFITLVLIHFLACMIPGPALLYTLNVLAEKDLKSATKIVLGIAIANGIEVTLSVMGISLLATLAKKFHDALYLISGCILLLLGCKCLIGFFRKSETANKPINSTKYLLTGFTVTMFNPKVLILWPLILSPVVINYNIVYKVLTAVYFITSTFLFMFSIIYLASIFKEKVIKYLQYAQGLFGTMIIAFAMLMMWKGVS